jgi:hypothetical protein
MADPNQTPPIGEWACPCSGCQRAVKWERKQLVNLLLEHKNQYLKDRGSSFDEDNNLLWAKDDALSYAESIDNVILMIEERNPKPKLRK